MGSRARYALIGLFAVALTASLFGFLFWFSTGPAVPKLDVKVVFRDKVSGLGRGSSVLFNGLNIGEVTRIEIDPDDPRQIYAVIKIDPATPLRSDTRARIEAQGFAGIVAVQLLGGEPDSPVLTTQSGQTLPTIFAEPSESILETVRTVAKRADDAINGLEAMIQTNAGTISATVKKAEEFSTGLSGSSEEIERLMKSAGSLADFIAPMTVKLGTVTQGLTETVHSLDRKRIASTIDEVGKVAGALGSGDMREAVKNVASSADRLNRAADLVEGVLIDAQAFLNKAAGQDGPNAFDTVSEAARSIRRLAENLDRQTAQFTFEILRFTDGGLGGLKAIATSGRRTLMGIGRTLRDVDRDPQGLFFGGKKTLPQYNGSR
jgi:phospholipid/cholesterol/gamma-HCH transport system substrate-binding protein